MTRRDNTVPTGKPLPTTTPKYDPVQAEVMRRTIEQNFEDLYAFLVRTRDGYDTDAFLSGVETDFLFMGPNSSGTSTLAQTTRSVRTVTSATTLGNADDVVLVDASGGAVTITLPPAAAATKEFCIKKIDTSGLVVTVDGNGSETIDNSLTILLATPYDAIRVTSDGTSWWIL